jgi:anti-anti-sigma factor
MSFQTETLEQVEVLSIDSEQLSDDHVIMSLGKQLHDHVSIQSQGQVLLDLSKVKYISSLMVGQLISLKKACQRDNVDLRICGVKPVIMEVLKLVRFDKMVTIHLTRDEALDAFKEPNNDTVISPVDEATLSVTRKRAEAGDSNAQFQLGRCLEDGDGIETDPAQAIHWYNLAANQGHVEATYRLGQAYAYGMNIAQDFNRALPYYQKAADTGHPDAQYMVALSLQHGLAGTTDIEQAKKWYRKSSQQGHEKAREALQELEAE